MVEYVEIDSHKLNGSIDTDARYILVRCENPNLMLSSLIYNYGFKLNYSKLSLSFYLDMCDKILKELDEKDN